MYQYLRLGFVPRYDIRATLHDRNVKGIGRTAIDLVEELIDGALAGLAAKDALSEAHLERLVAPFALVTGIRPW